LNAVAVAARRAGRPHWLRPARLAAAALVIAAAGAALAWYLGLLFGPGFVEYPMSEPRDIPTSVAVAPDGTVWFTIEFSNAIGVFRNGKIERRPKGVLNVEPLGLAVAPDGAAWYTDAPAHAIARMTPDGTITSFKLATPFAKLGRLAIAPDGAVWFADSTGFGITRLKDGVFTQHVPPSLRSNPYGVAVDAQGIVWATLQGANKLARISRDSQVTEIEIPTRASGPSDVAVDAQGAVWFLEFRGNQIGRYADGRVTEFPVPTPKAGLSGLAVAPDGSLWFGELRGASLGRLRNGVVTELRLPRSEARPFSVAVDATGNVWYTDLRGWLGKLPAARARAR
jgi:virginiamycin B lyase